MTRKDFRRILLATTTLCLSAGVAQAQDTDQAVNAETSQPDGQDVIVVTGSVFRRTDRETPSPITVLSAEALEQRGLTSVSDALRSISADNSGSVPIGFAGGFAAGATGVSLRGLGVNSTLVLFDGLRGAYFPLADDGQRSFVDLNTIPEFAVERIEVLRDGASATYGADAIGGVVNVITRKELQGIGGTVEGGISEQGDVANQRFSIIAGTGDLDQDGFSAYIGGEYNHVDALWARDRGFPYNTSDLSRLTCTASGDPEPCSNNNPGGSGPGATKSAIVRRANQLIPGNVFSGESRAGSLYQILNPAGCAAGLVAHEGPSGSYCEQNIVADYAQHQPEQERYGITARATVRLGSGTELYAMGTWYRSDVTAAGTPSSIRNTAPANTNGIILPVRLTNGTLNPNNPFAAEGEVAQISYLFDDIPLSNKTESNTYRGAFGIQGEIGGKGRFSFEATGMHTDLDAIAKGYINVAALGKAVADGTYNFVNPQANTDEVRRALAPDVVTRSTSDLYMAQLTGTYELADLPGGPLQLGGTLSLRHERLDAPSANPGATVVSINPVNASGHRTVAAATMEVQAPVMDMVELNLAGRFDHYSEGFDRFSPKFGVKFTPAPWVALRATYAQGFRAPQFAEVNGNVVGYTGAPPLPCDIVLAHGGTQTATGCSGGSPYVRSPVVGINSSGTPDLRPERSRSFTLGAVFQPTRWFSATVDYYNITKKDYISGGPDWGAALAAYYAGETLPAGYTITLNDPDPLHPAAPRTVQRINAPYVNANEQQTSGIDVTAAVSVPLGGGLRLQSQLEATKIFESNLVTPAGTQRYVGTQGPYAISSGAGTPAWRANWQNTLTYGGATLSATGYYTSGYLTTAEDQTGAGTGGDCANTQGDPSFCETERFIVFDLTASYAFSDHVTIYGHVTNLFNASAPFNLPNYAGNNYNPTWSQSGIIGRAFRAGARFRF